MKGKQPNQKTTFGKRKKGKAVKRNRKRSSK